MKQIVLSWDIIVSAVLHEMLVIYLLIIENASLRGLPIEALKVLLYNTKFLSKTVNHS